MTRIAGWIARSVAAVLALSALGCGTGPVAPSAGPITRAKLGLFFGGQVQERDEIPFDIDPSGCRHGFRIEFGEPLRRSVAVAWEIDRPEITRAPVRRKNKNAVPLPPLPPSVERGEASAEPGETFFDRVFAFHPGDPLGTYNTRVLVDRKLVIDRSVAVYDPQDPGRVASDDFE